MSNPSVEERTKLVADYLRKLELIANKSQTEFLGDPFISDAAERNLQLTIEAVADLGNFIIRRKGFETPQSYQDIFRILCENGVVPISMKENLVQMARFRNLLVHGYARIDKRRIYTITKTNLNQLKDVASRLSQTAMALNK
ncbi:MAG: DUF86 domain-containing protein [Promethearchaeati archaeon SRVP18_Atabeyarchaeia-1]